MKGYSFLPEDVSCASARVEGVNASYKDLVEVCSVIRNKSSDWAVGFLELASNGEVPVYFRRFNRHLGHRRELGGRKGRYPEKAAKAVLKALKSAIANGDVLELGSKYIILAADANKLAVYPRLASKGRWARSNLELSRIVIVLLPTEVRAKSVKKEAPKKEAAKPVAKEDSNSSEKKPAVKESKEQSHSHDDHSHPHDHASENAHKHIPQKKDENQR